VKPRFEITAHALDDAGLGVGVAAGVEMHVADLLPGEQAVVTVEHRSPHGPRAWGRVALRLGAPAPERVTPACPGFGQCGGCVWQHLSYEAQLEHKRERVRRALESAGVAVEVEPVAAAARVLGYRNTGKYVAGVGADHALILGGYAPRTHRVVDMAGCRVVEPVIDEVREAARRALAGLSVYDERARAGMLRYVVIRSSTAGRVLVAVVTTGTTPRAAVLGPAQALVADARVSGVVWVKNDTRTGAILAGEVELLAGERAIIQTVAGVDIELGAGDFFQVNRDQAARLYARVSELAVAARGVLAAPARRVLAAPARRVIDVYCGVGGIAFTLARAAPDIEVMGIERNRSAVDAANRAAERAGLHGRVRFAAGVAADVPALAARAFGSGPASDAPGGIVDRLDRMDRMDRVDMVVVNPPRKGLDVETLAALRQLAPSRVIYVSCGPESLARDLSYLALLDEYRVERVEPFDLMPGTPQVETIAVLGRPG
jgi:23S rRNA (uracil1939-C5)-methyltransferase